MKNDDFKDYDFDLEKDRIRLDTILNSYINLAYGERASYINLANGGKPKKTRKSKKIKRKSKKSKSRKSKK